MPLPDFAARLGGAFACLLGFLLFLFRPAWTREQYQQLRTRWAPPGAAFVVVWAVLYALMFAAIWLWWARRLNVGSLQLHIAWWLAANLLFNYAWVPVFGAYLSNPDMGAWPAMLVIVMATGSAWVVWALWLTDRSWLSLALWTPYAVWLVFATGLQAQYLFPEREYRAVRRV